MRSCICAPSPAATSSEDLVEGIALAGVGCHLPPLGRGALPARRGLNSCQRKSLIAWP